MSIVKQLISEIPADERKIYEWQFALAQRLCQIMETRKLSPPEFARLIGVTEEELVSLLHMSSDPPLSLLARIAALTGSDLLSWVNTDVVSGELTAKV